MQGREEMSEGWICPKCGRALAPWVSECPCYLADAKITCTNGGTVWGNVSTGRCGKVCEHKTDLGYCRYTACINPTYGGGPNYGIGNGA